MGATQVLWLMIGGVGLGGVAAGLAVVLELRARWRETYQMRRESKAQGRRV